MVSDRSRPEDGHQKDVVHDAEQTEPRLRAELAAFRRRIAQLEAAYAERTRVQAALRESEERYRQLFENANDAIATFTLEGTITSVNRGAERLLGWSRAELIGQHIRKVATPASVARAEERVQRWRAGEKLPSIFEAELVRKDGSVVPVEARTRVMRDRAGQPIGFQGIYRDITERKHAEEVLTKREQEFRALVEHLPGMVARFDTELRHLYVSPAVEKVTGILSQGFLGKTNRELGMPQEVVAIWDEKLRQVFATGQEETCEFEFLGPSGTRFYQSYFVPEFATDGVVETVLGVAHDITEHKRAEEALRASERRYRSLFENANDGIVTFTLEGIVTSVNRGLEAMLDWSREELIGQHYRKFVTPASVALGQDRTRRFLAGERLSSIFEAEQVRKDGTIVPVECRTRAIRDPDGTPLGFQGIYRDISARKALEHQRAEFLAMLTHDIRNPLGVILGYTEVLLENTAERGTAEDTGLLERLRDNALTVHSLINNYLDFSRLESGQLTVTTRPLVLTDLLVGVGRRYEADARRRRITLALQLPPALPPVAADPLALERVFANLIHNALKFTPAGGQVTLSTMAIPAAVAVTVADTGPGIPPEELPHLFEKYRRVTAAQPQEGTGLGLFIVQALVAAHGGWVTVESVVGHGTRFTVSLPNAPSSGQG